MLPTLKYRRLRGDMTEVFRIVHDIYHLEAAVKLSFNVFSTTRGNKYELQKSSCHYNIRKYSFSSRVINDVVEADTVNTFKNHLDKYWLNQDVFFNFNADLMLNGSLPICM